MKILLLSDVDNLGWLGDIVDVKEGYARNYILPQGFGTIPTDANIKAIAKEKIKHAEQRIQESNRLRKAADAVAGAEAVIAAKCNQQGHLFGSVSPAEIAKNLREQGFEVADEVVKLSAPIKEVGTYPNVALKFNAEIKVKVTVVVVATEDSDYTPAQAEEVKASQQDDSKESAETEEA
ncbi:MAG TPA: 50S ribosomal protein L9 [Sedimentisphaerales bacterium]|nr:50S ribosomal protein L9 [Sedimentisphaerales bacterium]